MNEDTILSQFKEKVSKKITLETKGISRFFVHTPFTFDDGDGFVIILKFDKNKKKWILTDEGHTFMHLSYYIDEDDFSTGTRETLIENSKSMFNVLEKEGELYLEIEENDFGNSLYSFIQSLMKIADITYINRERTSSTFFQDLQKHIKEFSINKTDSINAEERGNKRQVECYNRQESSRQFQQSLRAGKQKQIRSSRKSTSGLLGKSKEGQMSNERITEDFVRTHFKQDSMFHSIKLEEQRTNNKIIKELLKTASKRGTDKAGFPEFIITLPSIMDLVIVVECKPDIDLHERKKEEVKNPEKYAVDGVLHYSKYLKQDFNVIAIAISGENIEQIKVSNFFIKKRSNDIKELSDKKLLSIYDYLNLFEEKETAEKLKNANLLIFASELNQELYNYSVPENERATIVSGILIALQNKNFRESYPIEKKPSELVEDLLKAIERVLKARNMGDKTRILMGEYGKISQSNNLAIAENIRNRETGIDEQNTLLRDLIFELDKKVFPFTKYEHIGYDILGQFYSEFIRYVNGDKKLGLVLTPPHVTELFVDLANISVNDVIYDNCCGTAGFLIKGLKKLMELAGNDNNKKKEIRENQLIGVEERSDMFTYACSNMMMRGDGKSNIYRGDSLSVTNRTLVKAHKPTIGFLNPPYSTGISELEFIYYNLECLEKNGICVAIVPIGCLIEQNDRDYEWKKKLLQEHQLEAVFSMPDELFYPVGIVTSILVFKAHKPHQKNYETYFGYWKNDGFVKVKNLGRVDVYNKWNQIKTQWLNNYFNKKEEKGESVKKYVTADDEWCAEAFMQTDYSTLSDNDFKENIKKFVAAKVRLDYDKQP